MKTVETTVTVRDIEIYAYHGVYEQERTDGNDFRVTVTLAYDASAAMKYDDITLAVNYAEVVEVVRKEMETPSALLEHVAGRLVEALTEAFPTVTGGRVEVTKLRPPFDIRTGGATFSVSFKV